MKYEEFLEEVQQNPVRLQPFDRRRTREVALLSNEALFQLPFLAMVIMTISSGRRKPRLAELGQLVGECIEASIAGFKSSPQQIGWSANLRIRTVKALTFLELLQLVHVNKAGKVVELLPRGREVLERVWKEDSTLAQTLQVVERSYRNLTTEAQIRLEVR